MECASSSSAPTHSGGDQRKQAHHAGAAKPGSDHKQKCKGALHCGAARVPTAFDHCFAGITGRRQFVIFDTVEEALDHLASHA